MKNKFSLEIVILAVTLLMLVGVIYELKKLTKKISALPKIKNASDFKRAQKGIRASWAKMFIYFAVALAAITIYIV